MGASPSIQMKKSFLQPAFTEMLRIDDVKLSTLTDSQYVIPFQVSYRQNGVQKTWDLIRTHNSVAVIIFNVERKVLVCVRQFRPGVYINSIPPEDRNAKIDVEKYPPSLGLSLEFCAGIVDKPKPLQEIAKEEVFEECGYDVPIWNLHKIQSFRSSVGVAGDVMTIFYTEVTDVMKKGKGGGLEEEGEMIQIVELTIVEAKELLLKEKVDVPSEFLYGLMWFLQNKCAFLEETLHLPD